VYSEAQAMLRWMPRASTSPSDVRGDSNAAAALRVRTCQDKETQRIFIRAFQAMPLSPSALIERLITKLTLGDLLAAIVADFGRYELVAHWQQGEFHHDTVLRVIHADITPPDSHLVIATNCNGGVKEVLCVATLPSRGGLWRWRCPDAEEFAGDPPTILARAATLHWFDPCQLLAPDARSEYREEHRARQPGGGWVVKK
jgi:hypothetical protein